ncbi:MAG: DUF3467 domain-containing protein [Tidjanibacter sp.]|nr:DUF3467 domain-containing protein [Tidjanibacter sp.]
MSQEQKPQNRLEIELDAEIAQGNYSNLVVITHSTSEFILDFAEMLPGMPKAKVKSRVILTPEHAKRLLLSLQENVGRYESNVAKINLPSHVGPNNGGGFNMGQA